MGVIPYSTFTHGMADLRYFIIILILLMVMMLMVINRVISVRISRPILKLNDSVVEYEAGEKPVSISAVHRKSGIWVIRSKSPMNRLICL